MPGRSMSSQPWAPPAPVSTRWTTVRVSGSLAGMATWCVRQISDSPSHSSSLGIAEDPFRGPVPHRPHDRRQGLAGRGQRVDPGPSAAGSPRGSMSPRRSSSRSRWVSRVRLARGMPRWISLKPRGPDHQLADDQRGPAVAEHVDPGSDRAVLAAASHPLMVLLRRGVRVVRILYRASAARPSGDGVIGHLRACRRASRTAVAGTAPPLVASSRSSASSSGQDTRRSIRGLSR